MNPFIVGASAIGHAMSMTRIRFGGAHVVPSGGISNCTSALVGMMSFLVGVSAASLDLSVLGTEDRVPGARSGRFEWVIGAVFVPHPDVDWPAGARLFAPRIGGEYLRLQHCAARARLVCVARP